MPINVRDYPYMVERKDISNPTIMSNPLANSHSPGVFRHTNYVAALAALRVMNVGARRPWAIYRWNTVEKVWVSAVGSLDAREECPT